jgi:hypothetical protein
MEMKLKLLAGSLLLATVVWAHDEGHGPRLTDSPKQGGVIAPVVEAKDAKLGPKAALVYKAELVRLDDGTLRVYLYDQAMNPLPLEKFSPTGKAVMEMWKKKTVNKKPFELKKEADAFVGQAPQATSKPFNIDVTLEEGPRKLLAAFDNLD